MWVYLWYVSYRLLFGLPESLELLAYPASKVYKVGKRGGRDKETEMGRRAKKVTADRDQEVRTGQDTRKEVFMPKRVRRKKGKEGRGGAE